MAKYISPIHNISFEGPIDYFGIMQAVEPYDIFKGPILAQVGGLFYGMIKKCPVFFMNINHGEYGIMLNHEVSLQMNGFLETLWYIKDNAAYIRYGFLFDDNSMDINLSEGSSSLTTANGLREIVTFNNEEIKLAIQFHDKMKNLLEYKDIPQGIHYGNSYKPGFGLIEYNSFNKFAKAINFIKNARNSSNVLNKISWYIVAIESLYKFTEKNDLAFKLSYRVPHFLGESQEDKEQLYKLILDGYELRSNLLHGGKIEKKHLKDSELHKEISVNLDLVLRRTFTEIINNDEKRDILNIPSKFNTFFHNVFLK